MHKNTQSHTPYARKCENARLFLVLLFLNNIYTFLWDQVLRENMLSAILKTIYVLI